jgi:hypothetical protein
MKSVLSRARVPFLAVAAACLLAVGGGWAIAASTTSSATIRACANNSTGALRLAASCKRSERRVSWNTVGPRGRRGLQGIQGAKGDTGATGAAGAAGAAGTPGAQGLPGAPRAYGRVDPIGGLTRSKNVAGVTHPLGGAGGVYCIQLAAGIDASQTGLVATLDFSGDVTDTGPNAFASWVEWETDAPDCPAGQLQVDTFTRTVSTTGSPDGDVRTIDNELNNSAFFFVVP